MYNVSKIETTEIKKIINNSFHINKETLAKFLKSLQKYYSDFQPSLKITKMLYCSISYAALINHYSKHTTDLLINYLKNKKVSPFYPQQDMKIFKFRFDYPPLSTIDEYDETSYEKMLFQDNISNTIMTLDMKIMFKTNSYINLVFPSFRNNILEFTSYYGSIKCFKFYLLNGFEVSNDINKYAICGKNIEIINILIRRDVTFNDCIEYAFMFRSGEKICSYLYDNYSNNLTENCYFYSFSSYDIESIKWIIERFGNDFIYENITLLTRKGCDLLMQNSENENVFPNIEDVIKCEICKQKIRSFSKSMAIIISKIQNIDCACILTEKFINDINNIESISDVFTYFKSKGLLDRIDYSEIDQYAEIHDLQIFNKYIMILVDTDEYEFYSNIKNNKNIFIFKYGIFRNGFDQYEPIELKNGSEFYSVKHSRLINPEELISKKEYYSVFLIYEKYKYEKFEATIDIVQESYKPRCALIGDLFDVGYHINPETIILPNENCSDIDKITSEDELFKKEFNSYQDVIIACDFLYMKQNRNIKVKERPSLKPYYNALRIRCSEDCKFKIIAKEIDGRWKVTDFEKHTCNTNDLNYHWKASKETLKYIIKMNEKSSIDLLRTSNLLQQSKKSLRTFAKKLSDPLTENGTIRFDKVIDYIIQIKEDGGDAICP